MSLRTLSFVWSLAVIVALPGAVFGQSDCPDDCSSVTWLVEEGGRSSTISGMQSYPLDSLSVVARGLLQRLQEDGYYEATIRTVDTANTSGGRRITFTVDRGAQAVIDRVEVSGISVLDSAAVRDLIDSAPGEVAQTDHLEADIDRLLQYYSEIGYPLAEAEIRQLELHGEPPRLRVEIHVNEGPAVRLADVELPGRERIRSSFVERLLDLSSGEPLTEYDPQGIRRRLLATGLFASVGEPRLVTAGGRDVVLRIPVEEAAPGQFDLVLGYKPPSGQMSGQLVGHGFIDLQNLFGRGRQFHFQMDRMSGQVNELSLGVNLPFTAGFPMRTGLQFEGYQQDSTYGTRTFDAEVGYRVSGNLELLLSGRWKVIRPGLARAEGLISRSSVWSGGVGIRYRNVDHRINPRQGWLFELSLNRGRKQHRDTLSIIDQRRIESQLRTFWPLFERQVVVVGYDAWYLGSAAYEEPDLYKIGGTRTLRGYGEQQFAVRSAVRGLLEYRLQIDRRSYGFLFSDLGYLVRPAYGGREEDVWWRRGYGVGGQLETEIGLVRISYALTPKTGVAGGRVHIGMSLAL